jgi:hypothetical protein
VRNDSVDSLEILNGLHHLVEAGFEHTCLTSSNILLGSDGMVKIGTLFIFDSRLVMLSRLQLHWSTAFNAPRDSLKLQ